MDKLLPAALAFFAGAGVSFINHLIAKAAMKKGGFGLMPLRTLILFVLAASLYFIGKNLACGPAPLLIGAAAGATAGLIVSTVILIRAARREGENDG